MPIPINTASPWTSGTGTSDGTQPSAISPSPAAKHDKVHPRITRSEDDPATASVS